MAKMYKKKDLQMIEGRLVAEDGTIININPKIVTQLNNLETRYQKALWLYSQPKASAGPDFSKFKRQSVKEARDCCYFSIETPTLDAEAKRSLDYMRELDAKNLMDDINEEMKKFNDLAQWVKSDYVFDEFANCGEMIDAPFIEDDFGDILHLTTDQIGEILVAVYRDTLRSEGIYEDIELDYFEDKDSENFVNSCFGKGYANNDGKACLDGTDCVEDEEDGEPEQG